jgi:hypothetical protein
MVRIMDIAWNLENPYDVLPMERALVSHPVADPKRLPDSLGKHAYGPLPTLSRFQKAF